MRGRQCGVASYVWGVIVVLVLAMLVAVFFGAQRYIERVDRQGYERGRDETDAAYKARDNAALQNVITERDRLLKERDAKADALEHAITEKEVDHADEVARLERERDAALARSRLWRDPGKARACAPAGGDTTTAGAATDTGEPARRDGGGELSEEARIFLVGEATRADKVVAKLVLCRATLIEERR